MYASRDAYRPSRVGAPRARSQTSPLRGEPLTGIQDALLDEVGAAADATGGRETRGHLSRASVIVIASRTLVRSRAGVNFLAGRRVPQRATSTRRATSNWSRPNGTAHTGTPRSSAFCFF